MAQAAEQEYNYSLYALFDAVTTQQISEMVKTIEEKFADKLLYKQGEAPHLTVIYGPPIYGKTEEIKTVKEIETVLPGFMSKFQGTLPKIKCNGVSVFERGDRCIIKLGFDSEELTAMHVFLRHSLPALEKKYVQYAEKVKDGSYALPPRDWLHATLAVVKPEYVKEVLVEAQRLESSFAATQQQRRDDAFSTEKRLNFSKEVTVAQLVLLTAKTDTVLPLW